MFASPLAPLPLLHVPTVTKGGSAGLVVGIVVLLMMLAAGTGGGLVVYQKRLLCFRKTGKFGLRGTGKGKANCGLMWRMVGSQQ